MKTAKDVKRIVIAGAGTMGSSMGETFAKYGYDVTLYDIFPSALEKAGNLIRLNQETEVAEHVVTPEESAALLERIRYSEDKACFEGADLVVEAILEKLDVKHAFWAEISALVPEDAILASNTSGLSITAIAEVVKRPERFGGMHWINPPHLIPLIEVIQGKKTDDETAAAIRDMALAVEKKPVIVQKDVPGFLANRMQHALFREAISIVEKGIASPADVDTAIKYGFGMRLGVMAPMEVIDSGGIDLTYSIHKYLFPNIENSTAPSPLLKKLLEEGELGFKTGEGFQKWVPMIRSL